MRSSDCRYVARSIFDCAGHDHTYARIPADDGGCCGGGDHTKDRHDRRTYLKEHRTASSLREKKGRLGRLIGRTKGGMNTKVHAVNAADGRPLSSFMTAGQVNDYTGGPALLDDLLKAQWLLGNRGNDADWFRDALKAKGIQP